VIQSFNCNRPAYIEVGGLSVLRSVEPPSVHRGLWSNGSRARMTYVRVVRPPDLRERLATRKTLVEVVDPDEAK
jgi:hypothetical protein